MIDSWWSVVNGPSLAQGDILPGCLLPVLLEEPLPSDTPYEQDVLSARLIVVSQSCDLENNKLVFVALCPVQTISEFQSQNPEFASKAKWEEVRKGRRDALHLLASPESPDSNMAAYVVNFGHIVSLPLAYLTEHANALGERWRLKSPYLEHFSQAFARFFMRVGLPSSITPYK